MATFSDYFREASKDKVDIKSQVKLNGQPLKTFKSFGEQVNTQEINEVYTRDLTGDIFIWDNTTFGTWDDALWSEDADLTGRVLVRVIPQNNTYSEKFISSYFVDTTSNVTISNEKAIFADTTSYITSRILYDNDETINQAILSAVPLIGTSNLTYSMSADNGSNWETVTNGETHTFTNAGEKLRYRVDSSGTAQLNTVTIKKI